MPVQVDVFRVFAYRSKFCLFLIKTFDCLIRTFDYFIKTLGYFIKTFELI